jgi:hypothetical protein
LLARNIRRLRAGRTWLQLRRSSWRQRQPLVSQPLHHSSLRQQLPLASQSLRRNNFRQPALRMLQVSRLPLVPQTTSQPRRSLSIQHALAVAVDRPRHLSPEPLRLMSCIRTAFQSNTHCPAEKDSYCLDCDH